ncbi:MAG: fumarylacetoacetate hydrolase family protein [Gammaproteobacteria bacterium]|nr:fumarylacetoacetate hydrolase family protein [Gammaproteobacteria bacterium]
MHLLTFAEGGRTRIGVLDRPRGEVVDLQQVDPELPQTMLGLIASGAPALQAVTTAVSSGQGRVPLEALTLLAPIPRPPRNIFCVGKNFRDHAREVRSLIASGTGADVEPPSPIIFTKATSAVIGPGAAIPASLDPTQSVDYEGELAVVIGCGGRGIAGDQALSHVFGYTLINDVTSRRLQQRHQQWFLGKSLDGFCPMGPCLVTRDELPDVRQLRIQTRVNGELRQDGCIADLIFDIPTLIETLSRTMTLECGDIIATGTPAGVGMAMTPPRFLQRGDRVTITFEPIGRLENPVD